MCKQKRIVLIFVILTCFILVSSLYSQQEEEKKKIDKYFNMTLQEMMEIEIVTASRTPEKVSDIPASIVLITREDIETYGYLTLAEILENIPGLYGINDYEGGNNFGVRGFWSGVTNDNMIIMINGVSHVDDFQSNYQLNKITIPVEAIDRIEVIRGPMSVIYGQGAFYGAINIITNQCLKDDSKNSEKDNYLNVFLTSLGSEKTKKVFLRTNNKKGDFEYVFNASIYDTYGMDHAFSKMVRDPETLTQYDVPVDHRTGGRLEGNEKYFNFSGTFKNLFFDISHIYTEKETIFLLPPPSEGTKSLFITTNFAIGYKKVLSKTFTIDGKMAYSNGRQSVNYEFYNRNFYGMQQVESNAWETDLNIFIKPTNNLEIKSGLYFRNVMNTSNLFDLPSFETSTLINNYFFLSDGDDIRTRALYAQANYKPIKKLNFVAGVRLEQMPEYGLEAILAGGTELSQNVSGKYKQDKIEIIPRLAAIFEFSENNIFKFLYGMAINRPSFYQNSQNSLDLEIEDLKPEKIQTMELNYIGVFSSQLTFSTSVFRNVLENLITRVVRFDQAGNYETWSANAGKMVTFGVEMTLKAQAFKNFRLELSGTYQKTDDKRPGYENIRTAYSPNFLGYLKAAYRTKDFTFSITGNYVDSMEAYWDETLQSKNNPFGQRIGDRVDSYFLLGANVRIEDIFMKGLYLNIRCSNILDEEIHYPTFTNNEWATKGLIGPSRTFLLSFGFKF
jgi:outer membrane receptor for ferrienterochelin and colicin